MAEHFSVWCLGNSQKLLTTNKFLVSTIFFTNINISFFSLHFHFFSIIAKKVNQIGNDAVCVAARLLFVFCYALTTGRCNAFQHIFVNQKKSEFQGPYFQTMLFLVTMFAQINYLNKNDGGRAKHDELSWKENAFYFI